MPTFESGEMLGTLNVPNGVCMARPPPSFRLSSWPGVAWQEAQPPASNSVSPPLASAGRTPAIASFGSVAGIVRTKNAAPPAMASVNAPLAKLTMRMGDLSKWAVSANSVPAKR